MQLKDPEDRKFFHHLIESDALTMRAWNNFELPEEGPLMPALRKYSKELNPDGYITGALKLGPQFYRIKELNLKLDFVKTYPAPLLAELMQRHYVIPLTQQGSTQWFGVCRYFPFYANEILPLVERKDTHTAWQVIFPHEFYSAIEYLRTRIPGFESYYKS